MQIAARVLVIVVLVCVILLGSVPYLSGILCGIMYGYFLLGVDTAKWLFRLMQDNILDSEGETKGKESK